MDGIWNSQIGVEKTLQGEMSRHRLLRIGLNGGTLNAGDSAGNGETDPNQNSGLDAGPHFILSPETPQGTPTLGFEFGLYLGNMGTQAAACAAGFTVTIWALVATLMVQETNFGVDTWFSFATIAGVNANEMYHSFDVNAGALRFQIVGNTEVAPATSIIIALSEL